MATSGLPFDDIRSLTSSLPGLNEAAAGRVRGFLSEHSSELGRIEDLAIRFAAATGRVPPRVARPVVALFAATHGVSGRFGGEDPVARAQQQVEEIAAGAAPISHLCAAGGLGLNVFDLALEMPVADITQEPALDERGCAATVAFGMEAVALGADLICLDVLGSAGDSSAIALLCALSGEAGESWSGAAPDIRAVVSVALQTHRDHLRDPLEAMRRLGGREIAALAGAILAARTQNLAVILGGISALAAAAAVHALNPRALDHCLLSACPDEEYRPLAARLGLEPVLGNGVGGPEGVSAALAAGLVKASCDMAAGMAEVRARRGG